MRIGNLARRWISFPVFVGLGLTAWGTGMAIHFTSPRVGPAVIAANVPAVEKEAEATSETPVEPPVEPPVADTPDPLPAAVPVSWRQPKPPEPVATVAPALAAPVPAPRTPLPPQVLVALGRELFLREWLPRHETGKPDGLGPLYNDTSCVGCHNQGGTGGAGPVNKNVVLRTHAGHTTMIHHFSTSPKHEEWRANMLIAVGPVPGDATNTPLVEFSQRNTPALFGAGLIDSIPEEVLLEVERKSKKLVPGEVRQSHPGVRAVTIPDGGRLNRIGTRLGRFGWKGQTATLKEFTAAACSAELGIHPGQDLPDEEFPALVAFVARLPAPIERVPRDNYERELLDRGRIHFDHIGCANCHLPKVGDVAGIYSDLLLHDMGEGLRGWGTSSSYGGGGGGRGEGKGCRSCGVGEPIGPLTTPTEWRTPPLWGCRDSAPYLHDGRAETLEKAIALHGGQGKASAEKFQALSHVQQFELISFLKTLAAPE